MYFLFSKLNATVVEGFFFKDICNIVLYHALKQSFPLTNGSQKQHPVLCSQDGQPEIFSLSWQTDLSLSLTKMVGPPALRITFTVTTKMYILTDQCFYVWSVLAVSCFIHPNAAYEFAARSWETRSTPPCRRRLLATSFWESVKYWKTSKLTLSYIGFSAVLITCFNFFF